MVRTLDALLFALRREEFAISPAQAIDSARAVAVVGFEDRVALRSALASVIVASRREKARFEAAFDEFFAGAEPHARDFWGRLETQGFTGAEILALRELLEASAARADEGASHALAGALSDLESLLSAAEVRRALEPLTNSLQAGFYTHRVLERVGLARSGSVVARLRERLRDAMEPSRAEALAAALERELERARAQVRAHVDRTARHRTEAGRDEADGASKLVDKPFATLSEAEIDEMRRAVRRLAARLQGAARVRDRHARRGRIDPRKTFRRSLSTGGIPFAPARRDRRRDRPKLIVLCDVSDSVRTAACFMLELAHALQGLFETTRSFVFVSEVGEVTDLFRRERVEVALAKAYGGSIIDTSAASSYERVFRDFEARFRDAVDARTTVVILGDGRTNHRPHGAEALDGIRARAKGIVWLCPDSRESWGVGDSAMPIYATKVSSVFEARTVSDLERAAQKLVSRG